jgi:hypothetical protein
MNILRQLAKLLLASPQRLVGKPALGNLLCNSSDPNQLAISIANRKRPIADPSLLSIWGIYSVFGIDTFTL